MLRKSWLATVLALVVMALALPAGAKPVVERPEAVDDTFLVGGICDFDLEVHITGKEGAMFWPDRAIFTSPGLTADFVNLDTGEELTLKIAGTFHDTYLEGTRVRTVNVGHNILVGLFDGQPRVFYTVGKIVTEWDLADPDPVDVIESESPGKMQDVCVLLGG